jgi:hypothetical protein
MTIQIGFRWKELATRISNIAELEALAKCLQDTLTTEIMVYFEFTHPRDLVYFCEALKLIPTLQHINELEKRKETLQKTIHTLEMEVEQMTRKTQKDQS